MSEKAVTPPPPEVVAPTLPARINTATRKQHTELNRLIIDRLPLALPPLQSSPGLYYHGLSAFAQVYFTFESAWAELTDSLEAFSPSNTTRDAKVRQWLSKLRPQGLQRSLRLRTDLQHLARCSKTRQPLAQSQMCERMTNDIQAKPHTLIAYSWVMYMAIFSGGRWIRRELVKAGAEFWNPLVEPHCPEKVDRLSIDSPGYSFLSFDGMKDGEDIKALFKARLAGAETLLTQEERQDVIAAAQQLFEDCIAIVGGLDRLIMERSPWPNLGEVQSSLPSGSTGHGTGNDLITPG